MGFRTLGAALRQPTDAVPEKVRIYIVYWNYYAVFNDYRKKVRIGAHQTPRLGFRG